MEKNEKIILKGTKEKGIIVRDQEKGFYQVLMNNREKYPKIITISEGQVELIENE